MSVEITSDVSKVLEAITGNENFITIGELHNSRSAIKFIMDNIDKLVPKNDKRKTYLLTEFFPTDKYLTPTKANDSNYLKAKIKSGFSNDITKDIAQRESDKSDNENSYTLEKLFQKVFSLGISIRSIEKQDENSKKLYEKIQTGDISAYKKRVEVINSNALEEAKKILEKDKNARILIFAGMGHTASSAIKKFEKENNALVKEETLKGIDELMRDNEFKGISISIHDPDLCTDKDFFKSIQAKTDCFTKYEIDDVCVTFDKPDFFLFLDTPSQAKKTIKKGFESIFLPSNHNFSDIKNNEYRQKYIAEKTSEATKVKNDNTQNPPEVSKKSAVENKKKKRKKKKNSVSPESSSLSPEIQNKDKVENMQNSVFLSNDQERLSEQSTSMASLIIQSSSPVFSPIPADIPTQMKTTITSTIPTKDSDVSKTELPSFNG